MSGLSHKVSLIFFPNAPGFRPPPGDRFTLIRFTVFALFRDRFIVRSLTKPYYRVVNKTSTRSLLLPLFYRVKSEI